MTRASGCSTPPDGMAVMANWEVEEDRKAHQQDPDEHGVSTLGYQSGALENTEASTDHEHDAAKVAPLAPRSLTTADMLRLDLSHSRAGQALH